MVIICMLFFFLNLKKILQIAPKQVQSYQKYFST